MIHKLKRGTVKCRSHAVGRDSSHLFFQLEKNKENLSSMSVSHLRCGTVGERDDNT